MKKKHLSLTKLSLNKETISALAASKAIGGATIELSICVQPCMTRQNPLSNCDNCPTFAQTCQLCPTVDTCDSCVISCQPTGPLLCP